ncbi:MAG: hypothetical protein ACRDYZ_01905 [Acidimicrobiales bacterium]
MTLLVVLILVVLWVAVLGPRIVRRLREREPLGSVDSFYHELHLLDRAAPKTVAPANRLETAYAGRMVPGSSGYPSVSSMPGRPSLTLLPPVGGGGGGGGGGGDEADMADEVLARQERLGVPANQALAARDRAYRARQGRRRRRDVLLALLATVLVTGLLGTMHSFRVLWDLTALSGILLVAYLVLAVRAQQVVAATRPRRPVARPARPPRSSRPTSERRRVDRRNAVAGYGAVARVGWADDDGYGYPESDGYGYAEDQRFSNGAVGGYGAELVYGEGYAEERYDAELLVTTARAGYPGAWDEDPYDAPQRVAVGV